MVEDVVLAVLCTYRIGFQYVAIHVGMSDTKTQVTDDEVLRAAELHFMVRYDDACSGSRLSGQREVLAAIEIEPIHQPYLSRYGKADGQRFVRILLNSPTQRAFGRSFFVVRQGRHIHHSAASASRSVLAKSFCSGESGQVVGR